jgi:hypothetical protein
VAYSLFEPILYLLMFVLEFRSMNAIMYVCMYVCMYVSVTVWHTLSLPFDVCVRIQEYECDYVCMYVCSYGCTHTHTHTHTQPGVSPLGGGKIGLLLDGPRITGVTQNSPAYYAGLRVCMYMRVRVCVYEWINSCITHYRSDTKFSSILRWTEGVYVHACMREHINSGISSCICARFLYCEIVSLHSISPLAVMRAQAHACVLCAFAGAYVRVCVCTSSKPIFSVADCVYKCDRMYTCARRKYLVDFRQAESIGGFITLKSKSVSSQMKLHDLTTPMRACIEESLLGCCLPQEGDEIRKVNGMPTNRNTGM